MRRCILPKQDKHGNPNMERRICRYFNDDKCLIEIAIEGGKKGRPLCELMRMRGELKKDIYDVMEDELMGRVKATLRPVTDEDRSDLYTVVRRKK